MGLFPMNVGGGGTINIGTAQTATYALNIPAKIGQYFSITGHSISCSGAEIIATVSLDNTVSNKIVKATSTTIRITSGASVYIQVSAIPLT